MELLSIDDFKNMQNAKFILLLYTIVLTTEERLVLQTTRFHLSNLIFLHFSKKICLLSI